MSNNKNQSGRSPSEPSAEYAWLDRIIEEQQRINGPVVTQLIKDAAEAEELYTSPDRAVFGNYELEEFADKWRKKHGQR